MPNVSVPSGQDWETQNVGRSTVKRATVPKKAADITRLKAQGKLVTEKKYEGGKNASAHSGGVMSARKLEESEETKHAKVDKSLSKAIMQARTAKKMTQKDLATKINEKPQVVGEYESGKAIPNSQLISKIERALGCKLPRPGKKPAPKAGGVGGKAGGKTGGPSARMTSRLTQGGPAKRR